MIAAKETELIVAGSSITCGCSGLDDILTFDRDCKNVILSLEKLKKSISTKTTLHKFEASITAIGQIKIGDVCIDKVYIHTQESPSFEVSLSSKKKTTMGVEFDISNSTNKFKIDIQDTEAKDVKIDAVWKYLGNKVQEHQATFPITGAQLHDIFSGTSQERCDEVASIINKYSDKFEINTPLRMAHFLGQVGHETGEFRGNSFKEGTCYSETGKWAIWFNQTWKESPYDRVSCSDVNVGHKKNPWSTLSDVPKKYRCGAGLVSRYDAGKNLFCYVYRCEGGNGDESTCDGFKYRGHGFIHLTWKKQYKDFDDWLNGQGLGQDYKKVMSDPDEAFDDMEIACLSGMWYWKNNNGNTKADDAIPDTPNFDDKFKEVSKSINVQAENNENRKTIFTNAYNVLKK
ncbi:glycoside hydrolase family 19 protein [Flectobacillus longus]|uniref:glycoside hydrolase family 19 protein n=1 Tax=Flectobacillus longus TaxID=2984207 RepID=UPI0024B70746|nr:hypothetical protein [Flectobacillus longus]MDI9881031.1 hypothetical protein [Flectobacillus longus]